VKSGNERIKESTVENAKYCALFEKNSIKFHGDTAFLLSGAVSNLRIILFAEMTVSRSLSNKQEV
jgi:hypothetical protein